VLTPNSSHDNVLHLFPSDIQPLVAPGEDGPPEDGWAVFPVLQDAALPERQPGPPVNAWAEPPGPADAVLPERDPEPPVNAWAEQPGPGVAALPAPRYSPSDVEQERIYIDEEDITEEDIKCGRKEKACTHPGNREYRRIIEGHQAQYQALSSTPRILKTDMSNAILEEIEGRFVKTKDGRYYLLTRGEAREKVRQSLTENNEARQARKARRSRGTN